jgi:5-methyltetrahydrofolate--homocysteine methyltransferase
MERIIREISANILSGDQRSTKENVQIALDMNIDPATILREGMVQAMAEVGELFEKGEYYVPEMMISARSMQAGMAILRPYLVQADVKPSGKVVIGTVKGDLHDIGKNLVSMMLEGAGFEILDLGADVPAEKFVDALRNSTANLVALSALLTTTMPSMRIVIDAIKSAGLRERAKIIIGGAPTTETYAQQIGADGYAPDASRAVSLAKSLMARATPFI